jgi:hypothetical protein
MRKTAARAVVERLSGGRPSRLRSTVGAALAGGAVALSVYRGLRSQ